MITSGLVCQMIDNNRIKGKTDIKIGQKTNCQSKPKHCLCYHRKKLPTSTNVCNNCVNNIINLKNISVIHGQVFGFKRPLYNTCSHNPCVMI